LFSSKVQHFCYISQDNIAAIAHRHKTITEMLSVNEQRCAAAPGNSGLRISNRMTTPECQNTGNNSFNDKPADSSASVQLSTLCYFCTAKAAKHM